MTAIAEPPFVTFLRDFAKDVQAKAKELDLNGEVRYKIDSIGERRKALIVWFMDGDDPDETNETAPKFEVTLGKRYFAENVLYVRDIDEEVSVFMQADPVALLAYMTF